MQDKIIALPARQSAETGTVSYHTLPAQLTPLIGREQEVTAICTLLHRPLVRLVTLTGAGGIGKTRLGLQVAAELRDAFPDGVYFVNLAPIHDPTLLISTIAHELGIQQAGTQSLLEAVKAFLSDKRLLLLLDNFEQIVTAAPMLESLLEACEQLAILVTSREVLHLSAEHLFPVPPLVLPDLTQLPKGEELAQYASVALFLQRAQAIRPDFQLTQDNVQAIAEICVRLDGLPLAIELAAARIKLLPPQALLARLSHRLRVLTGGVQDAPVRQKTLHNMIAWSYDLLTTEEQRLFRWLSVFVGGCTLEAVEAICRSMGDETTEVFQTVASLIDKSLVQQTEQEGEEPHLVMLETLREFGLECLQKSRETEGCQRAYAEYYLALAEQAELELQGIQQVAWLERLEQEQSNLRAVMQWLLEQAGIQGTGPTRMMALRLAGALGRFWQIRSYLSEGRDVLERVLKGSEGVEAGMRAKALLAAVHLASLQGDIDKAEMLAQEGLTLYRELGDRHILASLLRRLGHIAGLRGQATAACSLFEESLTLFRELGDKAGMASSLLNLAYQARLLGEYMRARVLLEESLALSRELGNTSGIALSLSYLAEVLFVSQGDSASIRSLLEESFTLARQVGDKDSLARCFCLLGRLALNQGDTATARSLAEESVALDREREDQLDTAQSLSHLAGVVAAQGEYRAARVLYEESLAIARAKNFIWDIPSYLEGLAGVVALQGQPAFAARLWGAAESLRESIGSPLPPIERAEYEHAVTTARVQLGEQAFAAKWAVGRSMTMEQVLVSPSPVIMPTSNRVDLASTTPVKSPTSPAGLTAREVEVLRLVAQGLSDAQVAERLVISPRTVNWHLTAIYSKLQVSSRSAATRYAIEHKLV